MTVALSTAWMVATDRSGTPAHVRWPEQAKALDLRALLVSHVPTRPGATGQALRSVGVSVVGLCVAASDLDSLPLLVERASLLRAGHLVVEGGIPNDTRELAAEHLLRALYPLHASGVPLAIRNGCAPADLLDFEAVAWVLDELSGVKLVFDAARAEHAAADHDGADLNTWLEAYAGRTVAVITTGRGAGGSGGRHPEDGPLDWGTLGARAPKRAPWIFDPVADMRADEVEDALRALRAWHPGAS